MNLFLSISFVLCICVTSASLYVCFVLWKKYWTLVDKVSEINSHITKHSEAIKKLTKREILSNDHTVISFVKHIAAIMVLLDALSQLNITETVSDENSQEEN